MIPSREVTVTLSAVHLPQTDCDDTLPSDLVKFLGFLIRVGANIAHSEKAKRVICSTAQGRPNSL